MSPELCKANGTYHYYLNDHLGTPQQLAQKNGAKTWAAIYEAFGKATVTNETITNNLRFPGQYADSESGYHYNFHRTYDNETGRYIKVDPIGLNGGINVFGYAGGNPVLYDDSTGMVRWKGHVSSFAVVTGGGATRFEFELTSNCVNGRVAEMVVVAGGFALGAGVRGSGGVSLVEFDDGYSDFNPDAFEGSALYFSGGAGISLIGFNVSAFLLGHVYIPLGISPFAGFDLSALLGAGTSYVDSIKISDI